MPGSPPNRAARLFWGAALAVVALDVITKQLVERLLLPHSPYRVIGDVVRFTLAWNPGAAFSMSLGEYSRYIFGAFAVVALVVLWKLYREGKPEERLKPLALGLAWGGAAGNLIDRIRSPLGVVDFIDIGVGTVRFWTFNVADSAVTVGAIALGWILLKEDRQQRQLEKTGDAHEAGARQT
jgi:signal peptidase II